jgi:peptidoglycan/xylan/chitin deacetylase (PgdA/CDA1 family)
MRAILTYHSIDDSGSVLSVPEGAFRSHVEWLRSGVVRVVPLRDLPSVGLDVDAVAITFDDGLESFGTIAAPLLIEHGLPATVFVVSGLVGGPARWSGGVGHAPVFDLLEWSELRKLSHSGIIELGAHTVTHPCLPDLDDEVLEEEVLGSVRDIERETGRRPVAFAYPYGAVDERAIALAARSFEISVSTRHDFVGAHPDRARLPRLDMCYFRRPDALRSWGSAGFGLSVRLRRRARALRRVLGRSPCE